MDATKKVYLSVCFLVLVIGFYFHRVPRDLNHQDIYDSFQGVFPDVEGYDYFYLALQWPPSFCNTGSYKCHENATKLTSFTIHGLWPQKEKGVPVICTSGPAFDFRKLQNDTKLIKRMETFWPNLEAGKTDEVFWRHEWHKHGRCIGLDQNVYFNRSVNVYDTKNISSLVEELKKHGIQAGESYTIENYTEAIQKTFHIVRPTIQSNNGRIYGLQLLEIRLCVEKSGTNLKNCVVTQHFLSRTKFQMCTFSSLVRTDADRLVHLILI